MKLLCKYLGGSHSYGLATPASDLDERYLFIHENPSKIFGLDRHDHQQRQNESEDSFGWELRHFLNLLRNGNTMCLEMLFNDNFLETTDEFKRIQEHKTELIDSHRLFKCLMGYCNSERDFVTGKRTGKLGGKRKTTIDKYGYSYKNLVQFLRLCLCGKSFFQTGNFPVNIRTVPEGDFLYSIKSNPESCDLNKSIELMSQYETDLKRAYDSIKVVYSYNESVANKLCYELYMPILKSVDTSTFKW